MSERFLIDECLTVELVRIAHEAGFEAHHVAHIGLSGASDRTIFQRVQAEGFVFVTNNRDDFLALARSVDLHAGVVIILPSCRREAQAILFEAALHRVREIGAMVNLVLEVDEKGVVALYQMPERG